jgi:large subunit ribosomal protein L28
MVGDANLCAVPDGLIGEDTAATLRKVYPMAAVCDICGKKPSFGMNVSHSHRRTKRRWDPNIQRVRALVNGAPKRLHVCTSCIRAGKVTKPIRRSYAASSGSAGTPSN